MKNKHLGLISRIALLVICVEVIVFGALGWFYINRFSTAIDERIHLRLQVVSRMIANQELQISIVSQKSILSDLVGAPYLNGMVIGGNGRIIVSTNPSDLGLLVKNISGFNPEWISNVASDTIFIHGDNTLTAVNHIRDKHGASPIYTTIITISTEELNSRKNSIALWGQLGSLLFILLSTAGIIYFAQRIITRRVDTSLSVLKQVEEGNLDARINVTTGDELGTLQAGINSMTEKLAALLNQYRQNQADLQKQKDLLSSIIQNAPMRVYWKDRESRYVGCNTQFAQDTGMRDVEELLGKTDHDLSWSEYAEVYHADDQEVMELGVPKLHYEEPSITADGRKIWLNTSKVPLRDEKNHVTGILGIYTDISHRKALEEERQQREAELYQHRENLEKLVQTRTSELSSALNAAEKANRAKSEFLSSMSHELRTPMNAILGFAQLMMYDTKLDEQDKDSVNEILKAGDHLLHLINEVLDLAKIESGQIDMTIEPVEISDIADECFSLVSTLANTRNINILQSDLKDVVVRADRTRLKQALLNLLSNAIKYNRDGGTVKLQIQIESADRLRILVIDNGPGIPSNRCNELFQPFNRLDAINSNIEGTGIGLTITRHIIEMMGGTVGVQSEFGVGSTFWIELPVDVISDNKHDDQNESENEVTSTTKSAADQYTVLYIEDNPSNLKLVTLILGQRKNVHLFTAHTPDLGIELARLQNPDLILLDINLPGMDGYQVLNVFKTDTKLNDIPVIAVTANAMASDIERGITAGFTDYITKPLDITKFNTMLDKMLCIKTPGNKSIKSPYIVN